jgi:hypothetical protein
MATIAANCFTTDSSFPIVLPTIFAVTADFQFAATQDLALSQVKLMGLKIINKVALIY